MDLRVADPFRIEVEQAPTVSAEGGTSLKQVERGHITRTLQGRGWKVKGKGNALDLLGLSESTLRYRMKNLGIERPRA